MAILFALFIHKITGSIFVKEKVSIASSCAGKVLYWKNVTLLLFLMTKN